ncbi:MAG TPA: ATP-binding protein [Archangium sp.]|jgi:signal transduction histidine kinase|uniref:sensor histidine kinase n=1 Tax=Archangium sp. TaxID=1872627 RepID=UPI002ED8E3D9
MRLRSHLIGLVLVAVLPVLVFACAVVTLLAHEQRTSVELGLQGTSRALTAAVDERIASVVTGLNLFAASEDFDTQGLAELHRRATRAVSSEAGWQSISVSRVNGEQLLSTNQPFGTPLPSLADREAFKQVLATGRPAVSGFSVGKLSGVPILVVSVPVMRDGHMRYVLSGSLRLEVLSRVLQAHDLPPEWTSALLDRNATILARSRSPEQFIGRAATPVLAARSRERMEGVFEDVTQEGRPAYGAFTRSKVTGWTVVLGLPASELRGPVHRTFGAVLGGGAALLLVAIVLAIVFGRRIARPMIALSSSATALGQGAVLSPVVSTVTEVADIARALETAARERDRSEATLREANETLDTLHHIGAALSGELDLQRLLQRLTDEATALTGAQFGAYFHTAKNEEGDAFQLFTLSGAPREAFARFGVPRSTELFAVTFRGEGILRLDDVTRDARYGHNPPHQGMPRGHLPVCSYLAVPVSSRTGEVLGGLFFGHSRPGVFTEQHERLMASVAAQAAVAIDNASLYRKAQQAIQLRDDFLSVASHELKTPLTPLRLQLHLLLKKVEASPSGVPAETVVTTIDRMIRQVNRLARLVDELLDVSRIAAGRLELHPEEVELASLVKELAAQLEPERERTGSTLTVHAESPIIGFWDRGRLEQLLTNLISNALKYGAGKPIEVTAAVLDGWVTVRVRDHGIGIAAEDQARIFERFERAVSVRKYGGLGLGLWIVRRIVDALEGRISVESELNTGSCFTVRLPMAPPPTAAH